MEGCLLSPNHREDLACGKTGRQNDLGTVWSFTSSELIRGTHCRSWVYFVYRPEDFLNIDSKPIILYIWNKSTHEAYYPTTRLKSLSTFFVLDTVIDVVRMSSASMVLIFYGLYNMFE